MMKHNLLITRTRTVLSAIILFMMLEVSAQTSAERELLRLSADKFRWLISQDADSLKPLLNARLMYIHSNGWVQSRQEVLDDMASGKLIYHSINISNAQVRLYKDTGIVTGKGRFSGQREGSDFDMELTFTEVYVKDKKKWMLVSRHANRMP